MWRELFCPEETAPGVETVGERQKQMGGHDVAQSDPSQWRLPEAELFLPIVGLSDPHSDLMLGYNLQKIQ